MKSRNLVARLRGNLTVPRAKSGEPKERVRQMIAGGGAAGCFVSRVLGGGGQ
jgi:hypothetical protein